MNEIFTILLVRFSILMALAWVGIFLLNRAEPTWKIALCRAVFLSLPILLVTFIISPEWELPSIYSTPFPTISVSSDPELLTESALLSQKLLDDQSETLASPGSFWGDSNWFMVFCFGWGLIAAILIGRQLYFLIQLTANYRSAAPAPHSIQQYWNKICDEYCIQSTSVLVVSGYSSPHLSFSGKLVLPEALLNQDSNTHSLVHLLRHEASHLRNHDHYWFPAIAVLKNLFWFHPLAWVLESNHLQACENASDAEAARRGGAECYRSSIAELALRLLPLNSSSPALLRKGSSLIRRLEAVKRSANQMPVRARCFAATYGALVLTSVLLGGVILVPVTASDKKSNKISQNSHIEKKLSEMILPSLEFRDTPLDDALAYLQKRSVELDVDEPDPTKKGFNFVLNTGDSKNNKDVKITLKLSNVPFDKVIKYTTALAQLKYTVESSAIHISPQGTSSKSPAGNPANQYIDNKLNTIIIPSVEFQDTPLKHALAFLQAKSVALDLLEPDTSKKGVNFVVQYGEEVDAETPVTLKLSNVPLIAAVKYTTALARYEIRVEAHALIISPLDRKVQKAGKAASTHTEKTTTGNDSIKGKADVITTGQQGYIIEFVARPDKQRFQIIRHPSEKYGRATYILRQGEISPDGKFRINGYKESSAANKLGVVVDNSELEITCLKSGDNFYLPRRIKKIIPN